VLVWIHGGAFTQGSGSMPEYRGAAFARDGVVCVTVNYRLGAEGFLLTPDGVANLGLLDQIAALEWVRDNIAAFGGDPAKVTLAGESAGAMSVTTLLSMPQASGLFGRAIAQSGAGANALRRETAAVVTGHLAEALGVAPTRAAIAALPVQDVVSAVSALWDEIVTAPDPVRWGELALSVLAFAPAVDGDVLATDPLTSIGQGHGRDVALLVGTTLEEGRIFLVPDGSIAMVDEPSLQGAAQGYGLPAEAVERYRANRPGARPGDLLSAVITDWFFRIPAIRLAEAHGGGAGTWMYQFAWRSPAFEGELGACHAADIAFAFDTLDAPTLEPLLGAHPPQALADQVHGVWRQFIATGDPGWPAYDTERRTTRILDLDPATVQAPQDDERALWDGRR